MAAIGTVAELWRYPLKSIVPGVGSNVAVYAELAGASAATIAAGDAIEI